MSDAAAQSIDYRRIKELSQEFTDLWNRLHALYLDATVGFSSVKELVEREQALARERVSGSELDSEAFQDTLIFSYENVLAKDFCMSHVQMPKQGVVKRRNAPDGDNFNSLGQLCVTAFYDHWNEHMRLQYVIAKGKLDSSEQNADTRKAAMRDHASFPIWGDLRQFRVSIVHNLGVAIKEVEKCEVFKWFKHKDQILLTPDRMREIFLELLKFRNAIDREQYPERYLKIEG